METIRRTIFHEEISAGDESSNKTSCRGCTSGGLRWVWMWPWQLLSSLRPYAGGFKALWSRSFAWHRWSGAVYSAVWVRDYAKPYVVPYLASIESDIVDRLLWWVSAVVTYLLMVSVTTLIVKMTRRPAIPGIPQSDRNDQFAGFLVGGLKGCWWRSSPRLEFKITRSNRPRM